MTTKLPTYPSEHIAGFRKAVAALARRGVVPKLRLLSTTYRLENSDGTFGDLHATRRTGLIVWHHEGTDSELEKPYLRRWVPEDLAPYIDRLFEAGAQGYAPKDTPYTGESPLDLRVAMDEFAATCERWLVPLFGEPLDEIDRCVEIMDENGGEECYCK